MHRHTKHHDAVDARFDALFVKALEEYRDKQTQFSAAIAAFNAWHIDEKTARLSLSGENAQGNCFALTPIGTYLPQSESFKWAWANSAFPEPSMRRAFRIKELATKSNYRIFELPHIRVTAADVDELCALALHELGGVAVFKVKNQLPWCFYVVEKVE